MINNSAIKVNDISNSFLYHEPEAASVVIIFPGKGYTCQGPLLRYAMQVALQFGNDVLAFETDIYNQPFENIFEAVKECLNKPYKKVFFISKSLGTIFAGDISRLIGYGKIRNLFLTPIPAAVPHILESDCSVIYGSKDTFLSDETVDQLLNCPNVDMHVIKEAEHSLEIRGDYFDHHPDFSALSLCTKIFCEGRHDRVDQIG